MAVEKFLHAGGKPFRFDQRAKSHLGALLDAGVVKNGIVPDFAQVLAQSIGAIEHYRKPPLDHRSRASRRRAEIKGESLIALRFCQAT
ncbi:MAG TPA: hypothetical protein VKB29_08255 [Candidatus Binataceae bacterium]|nr:hypothetical protein [Candidatus Binataceae bacterium]